MRKGLFLCNSVYQVMVVLWLKYHKYPDKKMDVIISNHMNGGKEIAEKVNKTALFSTVYYAETLETARYRTRKNKTERLIYDIFPMKEIKRYVPLHDRYTDLFIANFDGFSQMLYNALSKNNSELNLHVFEDGLSTYCEFEDYYNSFENYYYSQKEVSKFKKYIRSTIYRKKELYGNIKEILVFNPDIMRWNPGCKIYAIDKIDSSDKVYKDIVNTVFSVNSSIDMYDRKYIFFEESFFADGENISDIELVEQLSEIVGKDNVMVKIHPRNPINRFSELGYKTNQDTSIPWEVLLMNMEDISDKVLITIASSAILNPIMIFGTKIKAYSLFQCLSIKPKRLSGKSWDFLEELFRHYPDMIIMCDNVKSIKKKD